MITVVSTPIGNLGDITLRAIETLKKADIIICEETKPTSILLKRLKIENKELFQLNEHSKKNDHDDLLKLCREKNVALVSDCGTPGFYDPGPELIKLCYDANIKVEVNPGASSLMALIALAGEKLTEFHFVGFLPAEKTQRLAKIQSLKNLKIPFIIMDTPYRLNATLNDLASQFQRHRGVLGVDLTGEGHTLKRGSLAELATQPPTKSPFVLLVCP